MISLNFVSCFFFCLLIKKKTNNPRKIKNKNKNVNPTPSPTIFYQKKRKMNSVISYDKIEIPSEKKKKNQGIPLF